jgi:hypothetical protein
VTSARQLITAACLAVSATVAIGAPGLARATDHRETREVDHSGHTLGAVEGSISRQIVALTRATARYHDLEKAIGDGYEAFAIPPDVGGTPTAGRGIPGDPTCFDSADGGMGVHYVKGIEDGELDLAHPEALVYEIGRRGRLELVAVEYIVPKQDVDVSNPPTMMGQELHPHPYLPVYILHAWVWRANPDGMFADYNPTVTSCAATFRGRSGTLHLS